MDQARRRGGLVELGDREGRRVERAEGLHHRGRVLRPERRREAEEHVARVAPVALAEGLRGQEALGRVGLWAPARRVDEDQVGGGLVEAAGQLVGGGHGDELRPQEGGVALQLLDRADPEAVAGHQRDRAPVHGRVRRELGDGRRLADARRTRDGDHRAPRGGERPGGDLDRLGERVAHALGEGPAALGPLEPAGDAGRGAALDAEAAEHRGGLVSEAQRGRRVLDGGAQRGELGEEVRGAPLGLDRGGLERTELGAELVSERGHGGDVGPALRGVGLLREELRRRSRRRRRRDGRRGLGLGRGGDHLDLGGAQHAREPGPANLTGRQEYGAAPEDLLGGLTGRGQRAPAEDLTFSSSRSQPQRPSSAWGGPRRSITRSGALGSISRNDTIAQLRELPLEDRPHVAAQVRRRHQQGGDALGVEGPHRALGGLHHPAEQLGVERAAGARGDVAQRAAEDVLEPRVECHRGDDAVAAR